MSSPTVESQTRKNLFERLPTEIGAIVVLLAVFLYFGSNLPVFRSGDNLRLLAKQAASLAIVASGMTLVIATGGIDISVGSVMAFCSMTLGWLAAKHMNIELACFLSILLGSFCGLINGLLIARAKLPPIIVTLAMLAIARAAVLFFSDTESLASPALTSLNDIVDKTNIAGFPLLFWVSVAALGACGLLLKYTTFGRELLAMGGNRTAAQLSGMPIVRTETLVYALNGAMAGVAAIVNTARNAAPAPNDGMFLELIAITSVVLGGTVITGGSATMIGTGLGVLTIGALLSGVRGLGLEDQTAWFFVGAALLLAVEVQKWRKSGVQA